MFLLAFLFPIASSSPSLALPTCPFSCPLATSSPPTSTETNPLPGHCEQCFCFYPVRSPSVGGVLCWCLMGPFAHLRYLVPLPPVAVHRPVMTPIAIVPCVLQPCIPFFRPPKPSDPPRTAPAVDHHMCQQLPAMQFLCALPPFCIREHPVSTVVRFPQGCRLPRLFVCSWGSQSCPPQLGDLCSVGPLC